MYCWFRLAFDWICRAIINGNGFAEIHRNVMMDRDHGSRFFSWLTCFLLGFDG